MLATIDLNAQTATVSSRSNAVGFFDLHAQTASRLFTAYNAVSARVSTVLFSLPTRA